MSTATLERPEAVAASTETTVSDLAQQFVTFCVEGETFAVPMTPVQEIIRVPEVARMPLSPPALDGLANLRGRVLPIVNLRRMLRLPARPRDDATRAVVIHLGQPLGFVVDRVASVISVEPTEIQPVSTVQSVVQADCLTGVIHRQAAHGERQLMLVVDFQRLVDEQFSNTGRAGTNAVAVRGHTRDHGEAAAATAGGSDELRLVSFTVAGQEYALDIADVQEIVQLPERIVGLPGARSDVLGMISLRERLLPLVGLREVFGLPPAAPDEQHRIVVVALPGGAQVGLVTDTVKEVLSVPRAQADAMPGVLAQDQRLPEFESICRLEGGRRLVSILCAQRLLGLDAVREALARSRDADDPDLTESDMHTTRATGAEQPDDDMQVVVFRLGAEEFGVPIMSVQEIVRVPEQLTRVPKSPEWVEGVINLRGTVLPVIDQRRRFGLPLIERQEGQRIMVYTLEGRRTGFIVDTVAEVLRIPRHAIEPAPRLSEDQARLISRVAKLNGDRRLVMLIEPAQLLGQADGQALAAMSALEPAMAAEVQAVRRAALAGSADVARQPA
jgi:purine-binding chemotaxis protein CheW